MLKILTTTLIFSLSFLFLRSFLNSRKPEGILEKNVKSGPDWPFRSRGPDQEKLSLGAVS
jgi:hypothetical protein